MIYKTVTYGNAQVLYQLITTVINIIDDLYEYYDFITNKIMVTELYQSLILIHEIIFYPPCISFSLSIGNQNAAYFTEDYQDKKNIHHARFSL